ncbi:unnamed protein product [Meloidogyne enterolobii]|uniref:Uncharacterized protein n=1 Tax=Meloidogyne enterolobii TaxID=390850 RepID=A0ACB1AYK2_MELEN
MYYQHQQQIPQQQPSLATNAYPMQYPPQQPPSHPQPFPSVPQVPPQPPRQNFDSNTVQQQPGVMPNHIGNYQQQMLQQQYAPQQMTPSSIAGFVPPTATTGAGFPPAPPTGFPPAPPGAFPPAAGFPSAPANFPPAPAAGFPPAPASGFPPAPASGFPPAPAGGFPPAHASGFPPGPPQPQKQRLDPEMVPSIIQVIEDDRSSRSGLFPTGFPQAELPPLTTTEFVAQDQGPVRCQRCKAYMCPFMEFIDGGRKFRCPFCKANSAVQDAYFAHLDHSGRRTDIQHRPELFLGSYEFVATKQYCKNGIPPKQPAFIFMLDVSYNSVRSNLVELFCKNIVEILRDLPKDNLSDKSTMLIGLATYDQSVHFYNLNHPENAEMLVVNDVSDIFVPFVKGFFVEPQAAEKALTSCLREIINNFYNTRITEVGLGPVIQAGLDALKNSERSGKLFIFHSSLPTLAAPGQLKNREERKLLGTDKEKTVLTPAVDFYGKLGEDCVNYGCAVDVYLFPNAFIDVASISPVVAATGGSIYKYQYFDADQDGVRFLSDLRHGISREIAFDVMLRLRTSTGIRPTGFFGNFYMQNTTDVELSAIDSDKSVQIEIKYDDKLDEREPAYFQLAVLFTSCSGQRRLRIHNLYRHLDEDCLVSHLFKQAEQTVRDKCPKEMRDELTLRAAQILAAYREKCSEPAPMGQLILPEFAKLLPLHINCIVRHDSLNGGAELTVDDRAWMMSLVPSMTPLAIQQFLYPRIYIITSLCSSVGNSSGSTESLKNDSGCVTKMQGSPDFPAPIRASFDYFSPDEAYLIDNGLVAFIWVGSGVPSSWLKDVFNVSSIAQLDTEKLSFYDNDCSQALRHLWTHLNENRERALKLFIVKEQDALESWMKKFLVEDRYANNAHSYVDFLCLIHREIRSLIS